MDFLGKWNWGERTNGVSLGWVWGRPLGIQKDSVEGGGTRVAGGSSCQGGCLETLLRFLKAGVLSSAFGARKLEF